MIDPERVLRMAYLPGEKVRVELGFQWDVSPSWTPSAATAQFRRFAGSRYSARRLGPHISLVGREFRQGAEGEEAYTSVKLEGVILESSAAGLKSASPYTSRSRTAVGFWCSNTFISVYAY
jgi:hypothetical protein